MRTILAAAAALSLLTLAACGPKGDFTPPQANARTKSCFAGECSRAMVMSADGRFVAVAGRKAIEVFATNDLNGPVSDITIGAEALATSPDGAFLLIQHGVGSDSGAGLRILNFDTGQAVWRMPGMVVGVLANPRHTPFRQDGAAVEVSPDPDYREVRVLNWRSRVETSFVSGAVAGGVRLTPIAVSEKVYPVAGWLEGEGKPRVIFGYGSDVPIVRGEPAMKDAPVWRAFSRDASLFGAEGDGEVVLWDARTGRITDRVTDAGGCVLAGGAPRVNQLMAACTDYPAKPRRLTVWRFPGHEKVGELNAEGGWSLKTWRVTDTGSRLAVLQTRSAAERKERARIVLIPLGEAGKPIVVDLGDVERPDDILFSMSGSGRKLAVRMPDGALRVYEPDSIGA